tara:strand:- start:326 stop:727 length:402 start_codon:yes stop_codon:yes gene_type:complete
MGSTTYKRVKTVACKEELGLESDGWDICTLKDRKSNVMGVLENVDIVTVKKQITNRSIISDNGLAIEFASPTTLHWIGNTLIDSGFARQLMIGKVRIRFPTKRASRRQAEQFDMFSSLTKQKRIIEEGDYDSF